MSIMPCTYVLRYDIKLQFSTETCAITNVNQIIVFIDITSDMIWEFYFSFKVLESMLF